MENLAPPESTSQPQSVTELFLPSENTPSARLQASIPEMTKFVATIFKHCSGVKGRVALRGFEHVEKKRMVEGRWFPLGPGLIPIAVEVATAVANRKAPRHAVFAPPVCVFGDMEVECKGGARLPSARADNVVAAPAIAVELDERPAESLAALTGILGEPTIIVASGGRWTAPDGSAEDKLHAYWRLGTPASTFEDKETLVRARDIAALLVGADDTAVSLVHPMRWPGSWHTKGPEPVLCRIVGGDRARDLDLAWAARVLENALAEAGLELRGRKAATATRTGFKTKQAWDEEALDDAARLITNEGLTWDQWNTLGMTFWDASHASEDGLGAFHVWSLKDARYDPEDIENRWSHWSVSPPANLSAGTLLHEMRKVEPAYRPHLAALEKHFTEADEGDPAAASGSGVFDGATPEELANTAVVPADEASMPAFVRELNKRHAFVMNDGRAMIVNVEENSAISFSNRASFFDRYANELVTRGGKELSKAEAWWEHKQRKQFLGGVDFDPDGTPPGVFNMWRGLPQLRGGEAGAAGCPLILRHIREIICDNDPDAARYLLGWLAHLLQQPGDKPGVAVVLKGKKGVGKDTLGEFLKPIMGPYYVMVSDHNHVTGQFNGHVSGKLLLHVEEAILASDKKGESVLKSLITAPDIAIERKGIDAFMVKSRLRILMTSNEKRVIAATEDERRFFVLNVSDRRRGDRKWFSGLRAELQGSGPACFASYLRSIDLSDFDVRAAPDTGALMDQKLLGLPPLEKWLHEILHNGAIGPHQDWPDEVAVPTLYRLFQDAMKNDHRSRAIGSPVFGRTVQSVLKVPPPLKRRVGEARQLCYRLPPLAEARSAFSDWAGQVVRWDE